MKLIVPFIASTAWLGLSVQAMADQFKTKYLEQTISHTYKCNGRTLEVSGTFIISEQDISSISAKIQNSDTSEVVDLTDKLKPHFETVFSMQMLRMICHSSEQWVYLLINNSNPWMPLEMKRGKTITINEKNEVEEGLRFRRRRD